MQCCCLGPSACSAMPAAVLHRACQGALLLWQVRSSAFPHGTMGAVISIANSISNGQQRESMGCMSIVLTSVLLTLLCRELKLRIGTQVLLTTNLDVGAKLVNGSRGIVTDFVSANGEIDQMNEQNVKSFARNQETVCPASSALVCQVLQPWHAGSCVCPFALTCRIAGRTMQDA